MQKAPHVKNNFSTWLVRATPFLLVISFVCINLPVFILQPSSFFLQTMQAPQTTFMHVYASKQKAEIIDLLHLYFSAHQSYPANIETLMQASNHQNWIYKPRLKNYDLMIIDKPNKSGWLSHSTTPKPSTPTKKETHAPYQP